jgi:hypothetical protein
MSCHSEVIGRRIDVSDALLQEGEWRLNRGIIMSIKISTLFAKVPSLTNRQSAVTILDSYKYMQDKV